MHKLVVAGWLATLAGCYYAKLDGAAVDERRVAGSGAIQSIELHREGGKTPVKLGSNLKSGDRIKTDEKTTAFIKFQQGSEILVFPSTEIRINGIFVSIGEVFARTKGLFTVETSEVAAGVEGTEFHVAVDGAQQVQVTVLEGAVVLTPKRQPGKKVRLERFQRGTVAAGAAVKVQTIPQDEINRVIKRVNEQERRARPENRATALVPSLEGIDKDTAQRLVEREGLQLKPPTGELAGDVEIGQITRQEHAAATRVKRNTQVSLWFKAKPVRVPKRIGVAQPDAQNTIEARGLRAEPRVGRVTGSVPPGAVAGQVPEAGTVVPEGSAVQIVVEPDSTKVPNVVRMRQSDAESKIQASGLRVGRVTREENPRFVGTVIRQSPSSGTLRSRGGAVNITVGVRPSSIQVPNVVGDAHNAAAASLKRAGFGVSFNRVDEKQGPIFRVLSQSPKGRSYAPRGSMVILTVPVGPAR